MSNLKVTTTDDWKTKRDTLNGKRNTLFRKYSQNPHDLDLALEIKKIDDEIAEFTEKMSREKLSVRKSVPDTSKN